MTVVSVSPFVVVAVMIAVPAETPTTVPSLNIEATLRLLLVHVTLLALKGVTLAESFALPPTDKVTLLGVTVTLVAGYPLTVRTSPSETPLELMALMSTLPGAMPRTRPFASIVAMLSLLLVHLIVWSALKGVTLAESCVVPPMVTVGFLEEMATLLGTAVLITTTALSVSPFAVVAVRVVQPAPTPCTRPFAVIVATLVLSLDHVTVWYEVEGVTRAESCTVSPTAMLVHLGATVTPVMEDGTTVTVVVANWPLAAVAEMV